MKDVLVVLHFKVSDNYLSASFFCIFFLLLRLNIDRPQGSPDALDPRCAVVVQTWQLLTLKDFHFRYRLLIVLG